MSDRERLIDLMIEAKRTEPKTGSFTDYLADYLIEHGVIVPPCKVGTYVYFITDVNSQCFTIRYGRVYEISITSNDNLFLSIAEYDESDNVIDEWSIPKCQWSKTVFLTREEAERALKERENNG